MSAYQITAAALRPTICSKLLCTFLCLLFGLSVAAAAVADTSLADEISTQLHAKKQLPLYFPLSVSRFYMTQNFQQAWLKREPGEVGHQWQAMLLLDCVLQYGLAHSDYHPDELRYELLHDIYDAPGMVSKDKQARFDIMLTDAVLTILNHLHYGKINPEFTAARVDAGQGDMMMETVLAKALTQTDITPVLLSVQPKSPAYVSMQLWMRKWKGQLVDDCYTVPEENVRKVAINMERLRWADIGDGPYVQVNIPSYTLSLFLKDSTYRFKIITGAWTTPTPLLQSSLYSINTVSRTELSDQLRTMELLPNTMAKHTGPAKSLLVFLFSSRYKIDLIEMPEPSLFKNTQRALSHGNIGIEDARQLADLLLAAQGDGNRLTQLHQAVASGKSHAFSLKNPIPFKVTYITCLIKDGQLVTYNDVYQLDGKLEQAVYHNPPPALAGR